MQELKNNEIKESIEKNYQQFVGFSLGDELYGIKIDHVKEVLNYTQITKIPLMSQNFNGIINIRGTIIPVIDMNYRFYQNNSEIIKTSRIIITQVEDENEQTVLVGILVDKIYNVIDIDTDEIKSSPDFGANIRPTFIENIGKYNNQFVVLLNLNEALNIEELSTQDISEIDLNMAMPTDSKDVETTTEQDELEEEITESNTYISFYIGDEIYATEMTNVKEILAVPEIRPLPNTMPFMKGIINLRSNMVPILDMRLRCNLEERSYDKQSSILIINIQEKLVGLIVDRVLNVQTIDEKNISETMHYSAQVDRDFLHGICEIDDHITIIVNVNKILSNEEIEQIDNKAVDNSTPETKVKTKTVKKETKKTKTKKDEKDLKKDKK